MPWNPYGDLQLPERKVIMEGSKFTDTIKSGTLTVYTTAYGEQPPSPVENVKVEKMADGTNRITWNANAEPDFCYYRIYKSNKANFIPNSETRIGSTIAIEFIDNNANPAHEYHYKITAVDQSGNESK